MNIGLPILLKGSFVGIEDHVNQHGFAAAGRTSHIEPSTWTRRMAHLGPRFCRKAVNCRGQGGDLGFFQSRG